MPTTTPHPEQHLTSSAVLQDVVIGLSDGLTVPFALAAGLSGAVQSSSLIITAGLAEIVAGSIAMGLGGYLAGRTEIEHYAAERAREQREVQDVPDVERAEVDELLEAMGLSAATRAAAVRELTANPTLWVDFMMKYELSLEKPDPRQAPKSAFTISMAYAMGGLVPLSAYFLSPPPRAGASVVGGTDASMPAAVWLFQEPPYGPATRMGRLQNGGYWGAGCGCGLPGSPAVWWQLTLDKLCTNGKRPTLHALLNAPGTAQLSIQLNRCRLMNLNHIVYISRAVRPLTDQDLQELLEQCRRDNGKNHITGILFYSHGNIAQLFEGEPEITEALFDRIKRDGRHSHVQKLIDKPIDVRSFPEWHMAFHPLESAGFSQLQGFLLPDRVPAPPDTLTIADAMLIELVRLAVFGPPNAPAFPDMPRPTSA